MESCVALGLARSIGVSNFNCTQLDHLLCICTIKLMVNQVECHPFLNQKELFAICHECDIAVTAYSPLANPEKQQMAGTAKLLDDPRLKFLAQKHQRTVAQVVLRYVIQHGTIPIPKSSSKEWISENFGAFDFALDTEDTEVLGLDG